MPKWSADYWSQFLSSLTLFVVIRSTFWIPQYHTSTSTLHSFSYKSFTTIQPSCWRSEKFQQLSQVAPQKQTSTPSILHYQLNPKIFSFFFLFFIISQCSLCTFRPSPTLPAIVPSTSAHQCSFIPHHYACRLSPVLHITHTQREAPMHTLQ
jgi:hypothetical protein